MTREDDFGLANLLLLYSKFLSERVGADLAATLPSKPNMAATVGVLATAIGVLPVAGIAAPLAAAYLAGKRILRDSKGQNEPQENQADAAVTEIVRNVQNSIVARDNVVLFSEYLKSKSVNRQSLSRELESAIERLASDIATDQALEKLSQDISMGKFTDRFAKRRDDSERLAPLSKESTANSSGNFRLFLERKGMKQHEVTRIAALHEEFVKTELPELSVLDAVQELRRQFRPAPVERKTPYPGKRVDPDAKKFLFDKYGGVIADGQMTTGRLKELDNTLYVTLYRELEGTGETIAGLVEPQGKPYAKRAAACAAILGTSSPEEAGRFFGGIRADRVARHSFAKKAL